MKIRHASRSLLLAVATALVVAACGGTDSSEPAPAPAPAPAPGNESSAPEAAEPFDVETYFEGKTIRFFTSSGAGGGTDLAMRTLASQLPKYIPGEPAIRTSPA